MNKNLIYPLCSFISSILSVLFIPLEAKTQIIPDNTLPVDSNVKAFGNTITIQGGTQAGNNLFHSFEQFSVPPGSIADFQKASGIQNIFTRVTGGSVSNINGIIRANGNANLFLLNPNGIVFGPHAQLNIGGSFIATTASSIEFASGDIFASATETEPLLTVSVPVGLGFANNSTTAIQVQGNGNQITPNFSSSPTTVGNSLTGLSVKPGKTLALVGSNVDVAGGTITAAGGQIELSSVGSGSVNLKSTNQGWAFGYEEVSNFKDIQLSGQAVIDASGTGEGAIQIHAANINLSDGSLILIQNRGEIPSGSLSVNASESLVMTGTSPDGNISSTIRSETVSAGEGANITVSSRQLLLRDGARIGAATYSDGKGGNVTVNAPYSVQLLSTTSVNPAREGFIVSGINAATYASGNAGSIQLSTKQLRVTDGGTVSSSTIGTGAGGDVTVNADAIEVVGIKPETERKTSSTISASSANAGHAGSVNINASQLRLKDGGTVSSSSFATGSAGSVTINASNSVEVSGKTNNLSSSIRSSVVPISSEAARNRLGLSSIPSGSSGEVIVNTKLLNINQGGLVSVSNEGTGNAGNLRISANSINLDAQGSITAATKSGEGGNISLRSQNLQLRSGSSITTNATGGTGNGGNITINTGTLTALENSNITANAQGGTGGRVTIKAQGLFLSPDSDITATSEAGPQFSGVVQINTPDIDPSRALVTLPTQLVDATGLIAQGCPGSGGNVGRETSDFIITGRGGLPPYQPGEPLRAEGLVLNELELEAGQEKRSFEVTSIPSTPGELVEATGWVFNDKGEVVLTADPVNATPYSSLSASTTTCYAP